MVKEITAEVIEGNKLISEFMGCYDAFHWAGGQEVYRYGFKETHITERWQESQFNELTPYHSSWNWLMPVVEKIEERGGAIHIDNGNVFLHFPMGTTKKMIRLDYEKDKSTKINAVWRSAVQFIKWHTHQSD